MTRRPVTVESAKANRREWTCADCGTVNTCWCRVCHGCQDVTYDE